jgi:hypothetical protein
MKPFLIILVSLLTTLTTYGQKKTIILHPDTSERYIIVYKGDSEDFNFNILMGYNAFRNSKQFGHDESKKTIIHSIDLYIKNKNRDTIILNSDTMPWLTATDGVSWINNETYDVIEEMLDSGKVSIYDVANKKYVKQIIRKKEKWRIKGSHGKSWVYMDAMTHKEIIYFNIYGETVRAKF